MKYILFFFSFLCISSCIDSHSQDEEQDRGKVFRSQLDSLDNSLLLAEAHREEDSLVQRVILEMSDSLIHKNIHEYREKLLVIGSILNLYEEKGYAGRLPETEMQVLRYWLSLEKIHSFLQEEILRRESRNTKYQKTQKSPRTLARLFYNNSWNKVVNN